MTCHRVAHNSMRGRPYCHYFGLWSFAHKEDRNGDLPSRQIFWVRSEGLRRTYPVRLRLTWREMIYVWRALLVVFLSVSMFAQDKPTPKCGVTHLDRCLADIAKDQAGLF